MQNINVFWDVFQGDWADKTDESIPEKAARATEASSDSGKKEQTVSI